MGPLGSLGRSQGLGGARLESNKELEGCVGLLPKNSGAVKKEETEGFPGGAVVKNLPANAGDRGSSPGPGRSHMPWSN